ncbi:hypothetical protein FQV27_06875 [Paracoccus aurantiacus]|uniref:Uncharacterized protein n=1 Tax=Paracoccus aurantiacus TaxID=2599412 RepID=A0A5C6S604_9RHOB|nr:hypothetical protein [Paracoccus aurantiacus]TXB69833.1 hypothetical protein FQV27_06875 [Paracoccus aurantiacus]
MQIVYHVGAHGSDHERLIRTLLRNREELWTLGTDIPSPTRYKGVFGGAITALNGGEAPAEMQETLLDSLIDSDSARRLILSQSMFLGLPQRAIGESGFYPRGAHRMLGLSNLFPDSAVEFFLSVVHPAAQVAELVLLSKGDYDAVMGGRDPRTLRWAPFVRAIQDAIPDRELVVWAQEDLPFIWPEVLRRMAGIGPETPLRGEDAVLADLLPAEALAELNRQISAIPGIGISTRRDMIEKALSDHATEGAAESAVNLPGWSQDLIDELSQIYAEDIDELSSMPGIDFIKA